MAPRRHSRSPRYLSPLTIAAAYLLVGTAWIFLSDRALTLLFPAGELARWQTVKGILYVAVTALLLFLLMRRSLAALRRSEERHRQMFETTTVALLIDPATATIEDANAAAEAFYGWPREDAIDAAVQTLRESDTRVEEARLVAFGRPTYDAIRARLGE